MFKIQIRNNGPMVDYDNRRFATRDEAKKAMSREIISKNIWADMRVVAA